jgi:phytoene dehydrogenase-like protein
VKPDLTIVGAGVTGLTAAIEAAEHGWRVTVAEAHSRPGGRARSLAGPFRANTGPHAIYVDGPWWAWLERRGLTPPIVEAPRYASLVRVGGRLDPWPAELSEAIAALPAEAPAEESFRAWLLRHVDAKTAEAIVGVVFIFTFDHDPGRLSAAFAHQRLRRALAGGARYVAGGWSTLAGLLAERVASLGAQIRTQTRVPALPAGPTILATSLAAARQLTGDRSLTWPSARVATFDLGLRADVGPGWFRVMDLDDRIYAARYSLADPTLAPPGHELIQIAAACAPCERKTDAERRVQRLLDQSWPGWRAAVQWHRSAMRTHCTGAIDPPGTTWHDRPAVSRSNTLTVATDQSAAPGLLAETGIAAAQLAVHHLAETGRPPQARTVTGLQAPSGPALSGPPSPAIMSTSVGTGWRPEPGANRRARFAP